MLLRDPKRPVETELYTDVPDGFAVAAVGDSSRVRRRALREESAADIPTEEQDDWGPVMWLENEY